MGRHRREQDHWGRKAKREGYGARSVYKLEELDRRFGVVPRTGRILDLGCAPGSWGQYAGDHTDAVVVGVDLQAVQGYPGVALQADIETVPAATLREALGGDADLVMSDMAPSTSGTRFSDHVRQIELASLAWSRAQELLRPGGAFVCKVFDGEDAAPFVESLRPHFEKVKRVKPEATRDVSVEFFVVCQGYRPAP